MYDCRECGACCFSASEAYVSLGPRDVQRLEARPDLVYRLDGRPYLRMARGRCAALERVPQGWACTIYATRPHECRALAAGSAPCLAERAEKRRLAREAHVREADADASDASFD
jgi:uncharacterized protein